MISSQNMIYKYITQGKKRLFFIIVLILQHFSSVPNIISELDWALLEDEYIYPIMSLLYGLWYNLNFDAEKFG